MAPLETASQISISEHAIQRFRERWPRIHSGVNSDATPLQWKTHKIEKKIMQLFQSATPQDMGRRSIYRLLNNMSHDGRISETSYFVNAGARLRFVVVHDEHEDKNVLVTVEVAGDDVGWLNNVNP